ncbi:MAG TPA: hypothetical protein VGF28_02160 [Thermoanaerobaculia bacterium]
MNDFEADAARGSGNDAADAKVRARPERLVDRREAGEVDRDLVVSGLRLVMKATEFTAPPVTDPRERRRWR